MISSQNDIINYIEQHLNIDTKLIICDLIKNFDNSKIVSLEDTIDDILLILEIEFNIKDIIMTNDEITEIREKRNDYQFRKTVINHYKKCIISGLHIKRCEVAHIKPFSLCDRNEKYDPNNGLLLDSGLHKLFDRYEFSINPETYMLVTKMDDDDLGLDEYQNKILDICPNSKKYIEYHYSNFMSLR
jgi:predicted restriction endonuclease